MTFLIHSQLEANISSLGCKLLSSLAALQNPSFFPDQNANAPKTFATLKNPTRNFTLTDSKVIHSRLLRTNLFFSHIVETNSLLESYFKCGHIGYALNLFEKIPNPNIVSWNLMISGCNKNLFFEDSWKFFCRMHYLGLDIDQYTYGGILSACGALECLLWGQLVYGLVMKNGFFSNGYVRAGMINLFSASDRFEDALTAFYDVSCENVVCWNAIISGALKNKENRFALDIFASMCSGFLMPDSFTLSCVLTACAALEDIEFGKAVQGWVIKSGEGEDVFVSTALVDMYGKCGFMDEAVKQFWLMPVRNVVSWTAIISGFAQGGNFASAVEFFQQMRSAREDINNYTITSVLTACSSPAAVKEAIQIHCWIFKTGFYLDSVVKASLMNMYSKIGWVDASEIVFTEIEDMKHFSTWATVISAFAQTKASERAIYVFQKMLQANMKPDKFSTSSVLGIIDCLNLGRQIHCYTVKAGLVLDVSVGSSIFTMYSKCGSLEESYKFFTLLEGKDSVSWASMIAGCVKNGNPAKAIQCLREMLCKKSVPNEMVLTAVLSACSALCSLNAGKEVHGFIIRCRLGNQTSIGGALMNMYAKGGDLSSARRVFDMMPIKDNVSCSTMLSGYAQSGCIEDGIELFRYMLFADVDIDAFTMSSVLGSAADSSTLEIGTQIHAQVVKKGLESEVTVGSSLLMVYSKIGSIDDCQKAFEQIKTPDVISWTAMITSYAQHGKGAEALCTYELMKKSGINPDSVTFIGILSACSHSGLVEEGYFHLQSMKKDYGIEPGYRHYSCMVDLLGRAGRLTEALKFIDDMPIKPDALVWGTLLAACKVHGDIDLGKLAADKVMEFEPSEAGTYVSLSNICADMGQWEEVLKLRGEMEGTRVTKEPGRSSI